MRLFNTFSFNKKIVKMKIIFLAIFIALIIVVLYVYVAWLNVIEILTAKHDWYFPFKKCIATIGKELPNFAGKKIDDAILNQVKEDDIFQMMIDYGDGVKESSYVYKLNYDTIVSYIGNINLILRVYDTQLVDSYTGEVLAYLLNPKFKCYDTSGGTGGVNDASWVPTLYGAPFAGTSNCFLYSPNECSWKTSKVNCYRDIANRYATSYNAKDYNLFADASIPNSVFVI